MAAAPWVLRCLRSCLFNRHLKKCWTYSEDNPKAKAITDNTDFTALDDRLFFLWSMTRGSLGIMAHRYSLLSCRYSADESLQSLPCMTRPLCTLVVWLMTKWVTSLTAGIRTLTADGSDVVSRDGGFNTPKLWPALQCKYIVCVHLRS